MSFVGFASSANLGFSPITFPGIEIGKLGFFEIGTNFEKESKDVTFRNSPPENCASILSALFSLLGNIGTVSESNFLIDSLRTKSCVKPVQLKTVLSLISEDKEPSNLTLNRFSSRYGVYELITHF